MASHYPVKAEFTHAYTCITQWVKYKTETRSLPFLLVFLPLAPSGQRVVWPLKPTLSLLMTPHFFFIIITCSAASATNIGIMIARGACHNIKMLYYWFKNSHDKNKMISWLSYLCNGDSYTQNDHLCIEMDPLFSTVISALSVCLGDTLPVTQHGLHKNSQSAIFNVPGPDLYFTHSFAPPWLNKSCINSSPLEQNSHLFADDIFKYIFMNKKSFKKSFLKSILIQISLKYVSKGPIDNKSVLVQVMAWHQIRWQAIIWTSADPFHRHVYAALGGDEHIFCHALTIFILSTPGPKVIFLRQHCLSIFLPVRPSVCLSLCMSATQH